MDLAEQLDEFLELDVPDDGVVFTVSDDDEANRLLRAVRRLERERDRIDTLFTAELDRLSKWRAGASTTIEGKLSRLTSTLDAYMRARHRDNEKVKTIKVPNGELRIRPRQPRLVVDDVDTFSAWLEANEHGALVEYTVKLAGVNELKKVVSPSPHQSAPDPEGYATADALTADGVVATGAHFAVPVDKSFTYATAGLDLVTPLAHDEHDATPNEETP